MIRAYLFSCFLAVSVCASAQRVKPLPQCTTLEDTVKYMRSRFIDGKSRFVGKKSVQSGITDILSKIDVYGVIILLVHPERALSSQPRAERSDTLGINPANDVSPCKGKSVNYQCSTADFTGFCAYSALIMDVRIDTGVALRSAPA